MAILDHKRALYLQLLRDFLDEMPEGSVVSSQLQNGTRKTEEAVHVPGIGMDVAAHELNGNKALIFVAHHVENTPDIPRIVRDD